jgi:hypothetical protein
MRIQSITVGKSRSVKRGKLECWVRAELTATLLEPEVPTDQEITELLEEVERILKQQEESENARWNAAKNK